MSDPTQKKLEAKSVGYKIGVAESERSLSNLGLAPRVVHSSLRRMLWRCPEVEMAAHFKPDC
jgi:hypothetical protein